MSDTGRDLLVSKKIAEGYAPTSPYLSSASGIKNTPLYYYILSLFWILGNSVDNTIIFFSLSIAISVPIIFYHIGIELYSKKLGLLLAIYFSVLPYFVEVSRWVWQPNLLLIFIPLTYLFFLKTKKSIDIKNNNYKINFLVFIILGIVSLNIHFSSIIIILFLSVILFTTKQHKDNSKTKIILSILLFSLILFKIIHSGIIGADQNFTNITVFNTLLNFADLINFYDHSFYLLTWFSRPLEFPHTLSIIFSLTVYLYFFKFKKKTQNFRKHYGATDRVTITFINCNLS